jgi:hypothetical protein
MKVVLTKLVSTHNSLRTDVVEGYAPFYPTKGASFIMFSTPLEKDYDIRTITTSEVQDIMYQEDRYLFKTENSTYELLILGENK